METQTPYPTDVDGDPHRGYDDPSDVVIRTANGQRELDDRWIDDEFLKMERELRRRKEGGQD